MIRASSPDAINMIQIPLKMEHRKADQTKLSGFTDPETEFGYSGVTPYSPKALHNIARNIRPAGVLSGSGDLELLTDKLTFKPSRLFQVHQGNVSHRE